MVPAALFDQLKDGGRLVCVLGRGPAARPCSIAGSKAKSAAGRCSTPRPRRCRALPSRRNSCSSRSSCSGARVQLRHSCFAR